MSYKNAIVKVKSIIEYNSVQFTKENAEDLKYIGIPINPSKHSPGDYTLFERSNDDYVYLNVGDWIVWDPDDFGYEAWEEDAYNKYFVRA